MDIIGYVLKYNAILKCTQLFNSNYILVKLSSTKHIIIIMSRKNYMFMLALFK